MAVSSFAQNVNCETCACTTDTVNCITVLQGITLTANSLTDLPTSTQVLILRNNAIEELPVGVFDCLPNLTHLDLSHNNLQTIPAGIFNALTDLEQLDLNQNQLNSFPAGIFDALTNLGGLAISANQLTMASFPNGLFNNLTNLTLLDIAVNPLGNFPVGLFDNLSSLDYLSAYECELTLLTLDTFNGLTSLESLELNENKITDLPAGTFANNTNLVSLGFAMNWLQTIPPDITNGNLPNLTSVSLADNAGFVCADATVPYTFEIDIIRCDSISSEGRYEFIGTFTDISQLAAVPDNAKAIIVRNNSTLNSIPAGIFDRFTQLEELDLGFNNFQTLPQGIFDNLGELMVLNLSDNQLNDLPADLFNKSPYLGELSIARNQLTAQSFASPNTVFANLGELFILQMEFNPLGSIPAGWFDDLTNMEYLGMFNNQIDFLPAGLFNNTTNLTGIDMVENNFTSFPAGLFQSMTNLQELSILSCKLTSDSIANGTFNGLSSLERLVLETNPGIWCVPTSAIDNPNTVVEPARCSGTTGINDYELQNNVKLHQNYPNPFHTSTKIDYELQKAGSVKIKIFDMYGSLLTILEDSRKMPGKYTVDWNPTGISQGQYYYQILINELPVATKKAVYLK